MPGSWQKIFNDGVQAFAQGDYQDALSIFEQCAQEAQGNDPDLTKSLSKWGETCAELGLFDKAVECYSRSLEIMRAGTASAGEELWNTLLKYGRLERTLARFKRSIELLEEALSICRAQVIHEGSLPLTLSELARSYDCVDRIDDERAAIDEALAGWSDPSKTESSQSIWICLNASFCYLSQKNYSKAAEFADRAREICHAQVGDEHPLMYEPLMAKAVIGVHQLDVAEAESIGRNCLKIVQNKLGPSHYNVVQIKTLLASLEILRGNFELADANISQGLELAINTFGKEHPQTLEILDLRALLLGRQGKIDECVKLVLTDVLPSLQNIFGDTHSKVAECTNLLAFNLEQAGRLPDAEIYARLHLDQSRKVFGQCHPKSISAATALGILLLKQNKRTDAEAILNECIDEHSRLLCEDTAETAELAASLASLSLGLGKSDQAESLIKDAKQIYERIFGVGHVRTKTCAQILRLVELKKASRSNQQLGEPSAATPEGEQASLKTEANAVSREAASEVRQMVDSQMKEGLKGLAIQPLQVAALMSMQNKNWSAAEAQYRQLLTLMEEQLGPEHPSVGQTFQNLGLVLLTQKKFGASDAFKRAIDILERQLGSENQALVSPLALLTVASGIDGRTDEAERYFDRCLSIREKAGMSITPDFAQLAKTHAVLLRKANREESAKKVETLVSSTPAGSDSSSTDG